MVTGEKPEFDATIEELDNGLVWYAKKTNT